MKDGWLDEPISLDDIYGKPTGNEWKSELAAIVLGVGLILLAVWL